MTQGPGPDEPFVRGMFVHVTFDGRTITAMVTLASDNGSSLVIMFDAVLGGYVGMMPLRWSGADRAFHDLIHDRVAVVTRATHDD